MAIFASVLILVVQVVAGAAVLGGFVWLLSRLLWRMTGTGGESLPGAKPTDRTEDDDEREIW